jgi:LAS superfamily LD-carboxypeptidase LdcB
MVRVLPVIFIFLLAGCSPSLKDQCKDLLQSQISTSDKPTPEEYAEIANKIEKVNINEPQLKQAQSKLVQANRKLSQSEPFAREIIVKIETLRSQPQSQDRDDKIATLKIALVENLSSNFSPSMNLMMEGLKESSQICLIE